MHVFSNALEVINAIRGGENWTIESVLLDVHEISKRYDLINFSFVPRKINEAAHRLAKFVLCGMMTFLVG